MIYTSYFGNLSKIPTGLKKIGISRWGHNFDSYIDERMESLAPSVELLNGYKNGTVTKEEYEKIFNAQLEGIDPSIVPDNSVLLCFEKPGDFCHRHLVAAWLRKNGRDCQELEVKQMTALERLHNSIANNDAMIKCGVTDVGGDPATTDIWMDNYEKYGCKLAIIVSKGLPTKKGQEWMLAHKTTTIFHATITGWGGTDVESGVKPWREALDRVNAFVADGFPKDHVVIRVDPILLSKEGLERAKEVMTAAVEEGYKNIKYSWCDVFYKHAQARFQVIGMMVPANVQTTAGQTMKEDMMSFILSLEKEYGVHFSSCAETPKSNPHYEGCCGKWAFEKCGFSASDVVGNATQRGDCACGANKVELIPYSEISKCPHKCVYCFCKNTPFDAEYGLKNYSSFTEITAAKKKFEQKKNKIGFREDRFYLSNFYPYPMIVNGLRFECVEAAFQSFKTKDIEVRKQFVGLDGKSAKRLGRQIKLREDWEQVKVKVMRQLIRAKFSMDLGDKLKVERGDLVEYNTWGDKFWGVSSGQGRNELGKILMEVRESLRDA